MADACFLIEPTATSEPYTLSLHDALPICAVLRVGQRRNRSSTDDDDDLEEHRQAARLGLLAPRKAVRGRERLRQARQLVRDRKSTRLNSSHVEISYAVFCLKKLKNECNTT